MIMNKDILAKLLAQENITVVQENVQTAMFNVKDRVLTLPMWKDMDNFTYNHLVGHEVGHALYTDQSDWENALEGKSKGYKSFLNVVEDARIEKLIQRRYPGLRRDFVTSYKKMFNDGFFGTDIDEINSLQLIDRLNTYFKCGTAFGVKFTSEEKAIVDEIANVEKFSEVVDIVDRLYGAASEQMKQNQQKIQQFLNDINSDDEEEMEQDEYGSQKNYEEDGDSSESSESTVSESEKDEDGEISERNANGLGGGESQKETSEPLSTTDEALSDSINNEFSSTNTVENIFLSEQDVSQYIVDAKQILAQIDPSELVRGQKHFKKFQANNKKTINYLVKEFEMKKKASEYARTSVSKTGVIDPVLMNSYRYSDDIFKKMSVTPEGKNHGLMMFIDWSGSMHQDMGNTIDQLLNLIMFCKQVQIPFRVYAFTDRGDYWEERGHKVVQHKQVKHTTYNDTFRLLEFFNSRKMKRTDMTNMINALCWLKSKMYYGYGYIPKCLVLGGTPLDQALVAAPQLFAEFKKENRLDIVNMVFLTDGESHPVEYCLEQDKETGYIYTSSISGYARRALKGFHTYFHDQVTKKRYLIAGNHKTPTNVLLRRLRDRTNANVIGYHLVPTNRRQAINHLYTYVTGQEFDEVLTTLKKDRFAVLPNSGYSKYFALAGGRQLQASNGSIEVSEDASKTQIRSAFKKANKGRKESRVMLSQFIDMVA